jgi:hypothetical protein
MHSHDDVLLKFSNYQKPLFTTVLFNPFLTAGKTRPKMAALARLVLHEHSAALGRPTWKKSVTESGK